ncbi:hypothetical protein [Aquimarina pacifica]|uniref:hypothetical protein n=1 Tax=Aquimarina pacifica TaxID=1296415 RepID=UPI00047231AE|nr:hypothetical protein [Aquimarina pacifica]
MKKIVTYVMILCLGVISVSAQSKEKSDHKGAQKELKEEFKASLSDGQKAQYAKLVELRKNHRESLKATYTEEQLKVSENKELSRKEKRSAIKSTFTEEQTNMVTAHKEALKKEREVFKASLNETQLEQYEKLNKKRMGKKKGAKRKE